MEITPPTGSLLDGNQHDKALSKPYEDWLRAQLKEFGTAADLIAALGDDINEELIIQIHAMERGQW